MANTLIIMRGLPGSGKSTKAKELAATLGGIILSTDEYFLTGGTYSFNPTQIGQAHLWNQRRCLTSMMNAWGTIIIDNTNVCYRDMEAYIKMAVEYNYIIRFEYPETSWADNVWECSQRNTHGVPYEAILRMKSKWQNHEKVMEILKQAGYSFLYDSSK